VQAGDPVHTVHSVASFFLSRIDTKADERLPRGSPLRGQLAIASARVAYQSYLSKFGGPEWERLRAQGAHRQRPLWASTGTKNPEYSDTRYVAELIGPDVVNTMPEETLRAFADHGRAARTLDAGPEAAQRTLGRAAAAGIDLPAITAELEREGVQAFCDAYHQLLHCIERKLGVVGHTRG
jgi:transaldolase